MKSVIQQRRFRLDEETQQRLLEKECRSIGFYDIETNGLSKTVNSMLTASVMVHYVPSNRAAQYSFMLEKEDYQKVIGTNKERDAELVQNLLAKLRHCDMWVGHFSTYFDTPFTKARALANNLRKKYYPKYRQVRQTDTWRWCRRSYSLDHNRLESLAQVLKVKNLKSHFDYKIWRNASENGREQSLRWILQHNIADVIMLAEIYKKEQPYHAVSGSFIE